MIALGLVGCGGAARSAAAPPGVIWSYEGDGAPAHWSALDPAFETCGEGTRQSPIDLPSHLTRSSAHAPPLPQWDPVPVSVTNNGHFVQVDDKAASSLVFEGTTYALKQFHFHVPSEHTIDGRAYDAEMHLVHKSADGKVLVIAVLFQRGPENEGLKPFWSAMPMVARPDPIVVPGATIDVASLLPKAPRYIRYDGSLTAPPCTEGVTWLVVEPDPNERAHLSDGQIGRLRAIMHGATARPVQPLNAREVYELVP